MPDIGMPVPAAATQQIRIAARALARAGLVHAYGHCSLRISEDEFIVSPPKPLGLVGVDDATVTVPTNGALPPDALPEVIVHQHIYRRRPDVGGVARFQSPHLMALSTLGLTPRARHGFGAYFAPCAPLHEDPRLVRDAASATDLVNLLGSSCAIVMRGNGAVTVGVSIVEAVALAWYLEDAARVELAVLNTGRDGREFTLAEARDRASSSGGLLERMWDYLTAGDPETIEVIGGICAAGRL
jgi:HCOMODA/2-hydroxy-3-carboxy-muconic semialdehyde decarboxylase